MRATNESLKPALKSHRLTVWEEAAVRPTESVDTMGQTQAEGRNASGRQDMPSGDARWSRAGSGDNDAG